MGELRYLNMRQPIEFILHFVLLLQKIYMKSYTQYKTPEIHIYYLIRIIFCDIDVQAVASRVAEEMGSYESISYKFDLRGS